MKTPSPSLAAGDPACPRLPTRNFLGNRFVYSVISQRAGGLSIGINLTPDQRCNFDCVYCEIDRSQSRGRSSRVDVPVMIAELAKTLELVRDGRMAELGYENVPPELLPFKEVALSGEGEPTLCPNFRQCVEAVVKYRHHGGLPFFKIVLITNATGLHFPETRAGLARLDRDDEVWAKLDAGTQAYMDAVNHPGVPIELALQNIRDLGRDRPVVIQSLFPLLDGNEPSDDEIAAYAKCLRELKDAGTRISLVQIYSAHRTAMDANCRHLPLRTLSKIARTIRETTGLNAEVF